MGEITRRHGYYFVTYCMHLSFTSNLVRSIDPEYVHLCHASRRIGVITSFLSLAVQLSAFWLPLPSMHTGVLFYELTEPGYLKLVL